MHSPLVSEDAPRSTPAPPTVPPIAIRPQPHRMQRHPSTSMDVLHGDVEDGGLADQQQQSPLPQNTQVFFSDHHPLQESSLAAVPFSKAERSLTAPVAVAALTRSHTTAPLPAAMSPMDVDVLDAGLPPRDAVAAAHSLQGGVPELVTVPSLTGTAATSSSTVTSRTWLSAQRRPRPVPLPTSAAVMSSYLLRAADAAEGGGGERVDDVTATHVRQPPPLSVISATSATHLLHRASMYPGPASPPLTAATAPPSTDVRHLQLPDVVPPPRGCGGGGDDTSPVKSAAPKIPKSGVNAVARCPDAPRDSADRGWRDSAAPDPAGMSHGKSSVGAGGRVAARTPTRTHSRRFGTGVGRNLDSHVYLNTQVVGYYEMAPPPPLPSLAPVSGGACPGAAKVEGPSVSVGSNVEASPLRDFESAACFTPGSYEGGGPRPASLSTQADATGTAVTNVSVAASPSREDAHALSFPASTSAALLRQSRTLHATSCCTSGSGLLNAAGSSYGVGCPRGPRGPVRYVRADVGDGNVIRVVNGLLHSPFSEELASSPLTGESELFSSSAVHHTSSNGTPPARLARGLSSDVESAGEGGEEPRTWTCMHASTKSTPAPPPAPATTAAAAAHAYKTNPISALLSGIPLLHQTRTAGRGGRASTAAQRRSGPDVGVAQRSSFRGGNKGALAVVAAAYDGANRSCCDERASDVVGSSGKSLNSRGASPTSSGAGNDRLRSPPPAARVHRSYTANAVQWVAHSAVRRTNSQQRAPQRSNTIFSPVAPSPGNGSGILSEGSNRDGESPRRQRQWSQLPPPQSLPQRPQQQDQGSGAASASPTHPEHGFPTIASLRSFMSSVSAELPAEGAAPALPPPKSSLSNSERGIPFQRMQSMPSPSVSESGGGWPSSSQVEVPPTFALFGVLERRSRFAELVRLFEDHSAVLDAFLTRLTLRLHQKAFLPTLVPPTSPARSCSASSPFVQSMPTARDDREFLRWHRIIMHLLRHPTELAKVGVEFFSDAMNSWPLHMLYLTCCFYVTAREHGFQELTAVLRRGGIMCSGKGLFAALAVAMATCEEDLVHATAAMYRAAFYTGAFMRKRHEFFESETRLSVCGGFTLLVVNIPIITLRRLVSRVNEGYDVFVPMRASCRGDKEGPQGEGCDVFPGTSSEERRSERLSSPASSGGCMPSSLPASPSMPFQPHSVIEVSRVISSRSAVLCGHPLDLRRLDMILARFADFNGVKIHKEYLPAGGPENSHFFNKMMAHELMELWKMRGVFFSLSTVQLPLYSPVNGNLWAPTQPPGSDDLMQLPLPPLDFSTATGMSTGCDPRRMYSFPTAPPTNEYRDAWWMQAVAEAATSANHDLTYSLRHMPDGCVLLDFSTHAMGIGRLIAWTNKSITVLAAPENRQESSAMPPPRRSPKDEAVRNTMHKLAIVNEVVRDMSLYMDAPSPAVANPSVELFTTFTELGLLEVLPRHRMMGNRWSSVDASALIHEGRPGGLQRGGSTGVPSPAPWGTLLDGVGGVRSGAPGVVSPSDPAASLGNRWGRPNTMAVSPSHTPGTGSGNPNQQWGLAGRHPLSSQQNSSLSLSSAGGAVGVAPSNGIHQQSSSGGGNGAAATPGPHHTVNFCSSIAFRNTSTPPPPSTAMTNAAYGNTGLPKNIRGAGLTAATSADGFSARTNQALSRVVGEPLPPGAVEASGPGYPPLASSLPTAAETAARASEVSSPTGLQSNSGRVGPDYAKAGVTIADAVPDEQYRVTGAADVDEASLAGKKLSSFGVTSLNNFPSLHQRHGDPAGVLRRRTPPALEAQNSLPTPSLDPGTELWHGVSPVAPSIASSDRPLLMTTSDAAPATSIGAASYTITTTMPPMPSARTAEVPGAALAGASATCPQSPASQQRAPPFPAGTPPLARAHSSAVGAASWHHNGAASASLPAEGVSRTGGDGEPTPWCHVACPPAVGDSSPQPATITSDSPSAVTTFPPWGRGSHGEVTSENRCKRYVSEGEGAHVFPSVGASCCGNGPAKETEDDGGGENHSAARRTSHFAFSSSVVDVVPPSMYEDGFVIRRDNECTGLVNVYQVSLLITYYEMQFNCVLCDSAVLFAALLKKASGIPFPSYVLLLCPSVFALLELWDGYEFEELWRRSLGAPMASRVTTPISAGLM